MNTKEKNNVLKHLCTEKFDGVFSVDNLPKKPRLLVANTDPVAGVYIRGQRLRRIFRSAWTFA